MTRRATRDDAVTVLGLAVAGLVTGMILSWMLAFLAMGLDYVGLHARGARGALLRDHPWQVGAIVGGLIAVCMAGSGVLDLVKQTGWRGIVPSWMWPSTQKVETTFAVRLGRVLHWISVGIAAATLIVTVVIWIDQSGRIPAAQQEHTQWETRHPTGTDGDRIGRDAFGTFGPDPEPYIPSVEYGTIIGLAVFAALIALFGRGLRYIIASE